MLKATCKFTYLFFLDYLYLVGIFYSYPKTMAYLVYLVILINFFKTKHIFYKYFFNFVWFFSVDCNFIVFLLHFNPRCVYSWTSKWLSLWLESQIAQVSWCTKLIVYVIRVLFWLLSYYNYSHLKQLILFFLLLKIYI